MSPLNQRTQDVGDNYRKRGTVQIYRMEEPKVEGEKPQRWHQAAWSCRLAFLTMLISSLVMSDLLNSGSGKNTGKSWSSNVKHPFQFLWQEICKPESIPIHVAVKTCWRWKSLNSWHLISSIEDLWQGENRKLSPHTHMLHVWNIYQHLPHKSPKCR